MVFGIGGSNGAIFGSIKSKMAADGHLGPIDMMFGASMRFLGSANLMVQLSVTLSDPEPQFQGHSVL